MGGGLFSERRGRPDLSQEALDLAGFRNLESLHRLEGKPREAVQKALRAALEKLETAAPAIPATTILARNLAWLGEAAGLTPVDQDILHFVALASHHPGLENALDQMGGLSLGSLQAIFSRVLGLPAKTVAKSLDGAGALARAGLLLVDGGGNYNFRYKVALLPGLGDQMTLRHGDPTSLFRGAFNPAGKGRLKLSQYPHLQRELSILDPYLRAALRTRQKGVNILIYGTAGTGKTELVRSLADHLGAKLFEVAARNPNGSPVEGNDRFRGYVLAQAVLGARADHLILCDEIEDIFRSQEEGTQPGRTNRSGMKAWVNKLLEENAVPAFWVTNRLQVLDEAFVRRFDLVIRLDNPPRSVRRSMLEEHLAGLPLSVQQKDRLAEHEGLSPAVIARAAKVIRQVHRAVPAADAGQLLAQVLGNALEALGHPRASRQTVELVTEYRPELVNTDRDLGPLVQGLRDHAQGRLCFHGPPGTGKTAYGRHLAAALDRPLMVRRASDLLSMWVGGTEKNLAAMFEEASQEHAVLLLDEADSFLQDRAAARNSWEVTQVNEMLTQLESFRGIFIASTNLMDRFDTAALRRFDLKVQFGYLRPDQAWAMFQDVAAGLDLEVESRLRKQLAAHSLLTPGDFATVVRQARLNRPESALDLLSRLRQECLAKPEGRRRPIGFLDPAS